MTSETQSISRGHQIPLNKEETLPKEIWMQIFSFLGPKDLAKCARVCSGWNADLKDVWKTLILNKFGFEPVDFFETYVKEGAVSWSEVFLFPELASLLNEIIVKECGQHYKFENENPRYENFWQTSPFAAYGDYQFSIINSKIVKMRKGEEFFVLNGKPDKILVHLAAAERNLFALTDDGTLLRWDYQKKEIGEVKRIHGKKNPKQCTRLIVKEGFIIILDVSIEIIPYHNPEKAIIIDDGTFKAKHRVEKRGNKIYFVGIEIPNNQSHILDIPTMQCTHFQYGIDDHLFSCMARGENLLVVALGKSITFLEIIDDGHKQKKEIRTDLNNSLKNMIVKKDLIFCFYEDKIRTEVVHRTPSFAILDLHTGKTLAKISDVIDKEKGKIKPHALKSIFNFLKTHKEKGPSIYNLCSIQ